MAVRVISFDCAQTLVEAKWDLPKVACDAAEAAGIVLDRQVAQETYTRMVGSRWPDFHQVNRLRSEDACNAFWMELTSDWLERIGQPVQLASRVVDEADRIIYGPPSQIFAVYDDVVPCLEALAANGYTLVVVSNWDNSLHRVLRHFGLSHHFAHVLASMEEGWEKPDPRLFQAMYERVGARPDEVVHIGDNPLDDVRGAKEACAGAYLIDRAAPRTEGSVLRTLLDLPEALAR